MQIELKQEDDSNTIECVISLHLTFSGAESESLTDVLANLGDELAKVLDRFR